MIWHTAMLGGHPVIFDDVLFLPQYIVMCQIFFPYIVEAGRPIQARSGSDGSAHYEISGI
jgi:hypothetical protein